AAHDAGVIHRDVKPANLIRLPSGRIKVTDFGIARVLGSELVKTQAGDVLATPMYGSPEQLLGGEIDGRSDLFSVGIVLYLALTGRAPFGGRNLAELISSILNNEPAAPRSLNHEIPEGLEAVLMRTLSKKREARFATAGDLARALRPFAAGNVVPGSAVTANLSSSPASEVEWQATRVSAPFPFAESVSGSGEFVLPADDNAPVLTGLPPDAARALVQVVSGWAARPMGRVVVQDLLNRLLEFPLHAEPYSGAVRVGEQAYLLLHGGLLLGAVDARASNLPGDEVVQNLPLEATVELHPRPESLDPGVLPLLAALLQKRRVRHADLDSSFVNLPALGEKLRSECFDGLLVLRRDESIAWILIVHGRTALALYAGSWAGAPLGASWQSWVSDLVVKASVEERSGGPLFASYRRLFPDFRIAVEKETEPLASVGASTSFSFGGSRRLTSKQTGGTHRLVASETGTRGGTRGGGAPQSVLDQALAADEARRYLQFLLNDLPRLIVERGKTESLKYVASWIPLVKSAILHHRLPRPQSAESDFFDLVTFDADGKALHLASRVARGTPQALEEFIERVLQAKGARIKTGDVGGAILFAPTFDAEAAEVYRTATAPEGEKKKSWTFGAIEAATHYEGFVRMGARRGFHLLLVTVEPDGFKLLSP
ncbi:MAG: serine/threonine-protein kinase, partial [Thermoanaerobaculia bacterium]